MPGICGIVDGGRPPAADVVAAMAAAIRHRGAGDGPFSAGSAVLAGARSTDADGTLELVLDGEIYNGAELRAELGAPPATDGELVLAAYRTWGDRCFERLNGAWALALYDARARRLVCSRDRFGQRPLYYRHDRGRFVFASELKAFRADPETPIAANLRAVRDYLAYARLDHSDETFFAGISSLPGAHVLVFEDGDVRVTRYWRLEPGAAPPGDAAPALRELFLDAVRLRMGGDGVVGACLSGGIDSSTLAGAVDLMLRDGDAAAATAGPRLRTFTAWFADPGLEERPYAEAVVDRIAADPHWVSFSASELVETVPAVVETQDEPFNSTSIVAQWHVMRAAREAGVAVMLDGQGSDEVFAGYDVFVGYRLADLLARGRVRSFASELGAFRRRSGAGAAQSAALVARPFAPDAFERSLRLRLSGAQALLGSELGAAAPLSADDPSPFHDRLRRRLGSMMARRGIPELLHSADRNAAAHGVGSRLPYLDYRLVELVFSLRGDELISNGTTKAVLRRALGDLLPEQVLHRPTKLGFPTPENRFFREELGELASDVFASRAFAERGFVDADAARDRLRRARAGSIQAGYPLWRALNLELWAQTFLDRR
jgi:asparagine synthase (glutamine-hydrolysing)